MLVCSAQRIVVTFANSVQLSEKMRLTTLDVMLDDISFEELGRNFMRVSSEILPFMSWDFGIDNMVVML